MAAESLTSTAKILTGTRVPLSAEEILSRQRKSSRLPKNPHGARKSPRRPRNPHEPEKSRRDRGNPLEVRNPHVGRDIPMSPRNPDGGQQISTWGEKSSRRSGHLDGAEESSSTSKYPFARRRSMRGAYRMRTAELHRTAIARHRVRETCEDWCISVSFCDRSVFYCFRA